jgi:arylsulfatase A-like enzyme
MRFFSRLLAGWLLVASVSPLLRADAYDGKPKLVVVLVFDQFRGDYLDRYRADFKAKNGWNLFLKQGAHFTDCYYDYANLITAAGHSTIGTGAYTDGHGVPLNEWYEQGSDGKMHAVSSVDDPRYKIVGDAAGAPTSPGASPYRELASTLGDELVLATQGKARVYGVSLKDRAAILTSGHATKAAFWVNHETGRWVTSTYWMKDLPQWAQAINASDAVAQARKASGFATEGFYERVGRTAASVRYQLDFANALIANEHLGQNPANVADMITISISSTDINGHAFGPDDPSQKALIVASDAELDRFFTSLDKTVGLKNVIVAMTGDHGVGVAQKDATAMGMPALMIAAGDFTGPVEKKLEAKWPLKGKGKYVLQMDNPYLLLNRPAFEAAGISEEVAENTTRAIVEEVFAGFAKTSGAPSDVRLPEPPEVTHIYTTKEMREGTLPNTQYGRLIAHSYSPYLGWALHMNFGTYQATWGATGATHFTANSYDRHVPLELYGWPFVKGTYHGVVAPVDIAATFASVLRINRPSAAVGRVLTEAMVSESTGKTVERIDAPPHRKAPAQ